MIATASGWVVAGIALAPIVMSLLAVASVLLFDRSEVPARVEVPRTPVRHRED